MPARHLASWRGQSDVTRPDPRLTADGVPQGPVETRYSCLWELAGDTGTVSIGGVVGRKIML